MDFTKSNGKITYHLETGDSVVLYSDLHWCCEILEMSDEKILIVNQDSGKNHIFETQNFIDNITKVIA